MAEKIATRHAYGEALAEAGVNEKIVALGRGCVHLYHVLHVWRKISGAVLQRGNRGGGYGGRAAGMATAGYIPFVHTFAMFCAGRTYDQIRNSIAYPGLNVKLVGTHAGPHRRGGTERLISASRTWR